jgi:hypothetical protein
MVVGSTRWAELPFTLGSHKIFFELLAIPLGEKNLLPLVPSGRYVINSSFVFDAEWPRHFPLLKLINS